jgi:hypothetical protein
LRVSRSRRQESSLPSSQFSGSGENLVDFLPRNGDIQQLDSFRGQNLGEKYSSIKDA